ncbi:MAG TPA: PPC domain-containing protein, partial [Gaiellaceae bacterium]|nr:PPC domain-containing protein [Gaiellaceae bacterium]
DQVSTMLKLSADDATPANGCVDCTTGADALSGFGRLDVDRALDALHDPTPAPDRLEPNDDAGAEAAIVAAPRTFTATLDSYDDPNDVYRVHLDKGQRLSVVVRSATDIDPSLFLWKPGLTSLAGATSDLRARRSIHGPGVPEHVRYRAPKAGWYYVQVKLAPDSSTYHGAYRIKFAF